MSTTIQVIMYLSWQTHGRMLFSDCLCFVSFVECVFLHFPAVAAVHMHNMVTILADPRKHTVVSEFLGAILHLWPVQLVDLCRKSASTQRQHGV